MHSIKIHKVINKMIIVLQRVGFWHQGDAATSRELRIKWFYCIYYLLFPISIAIGSIKSDNKEDSIFLVEVLIAMVVVAIKFWFLIWKQKQIQEMLNRICIFTVQTDDAVALVNEKIGKFGKFVVVLFVSACIAASFVILSPYLGHEKVFFVKIAFPMDWQNEEIAFFVANSFLLSVIAIAIIASAFFVIIWYLMLNCAVPNEVLGNSLPKMGMLNKENQGNQIKISDKGKHNFFLSDLTACIDAHVHIRELTTELGSFCSYLFLIQIGTSGLCICGSVYCLAFDFGENVMERIIHFFTLFYNTCEIFMITYFGNEIMLSSDRLSYCLFESDWIHQPQSTKKCIVIFGEILMKPHQLIVRKLFPLTLDTFTRIINSAYNMFNILKNIAQ